jgi:hypothetical protein
MTRVRWGLGLIGVLILATACDSGPKGPGALSATVSGRVLGAAVLEVSGPGITSFEGQGGSRVFSAALSPNAVTPSYRVIVVDPEGGDLHFGIRVEDVAAQLPTVAVIQAVDSANAPVPGSAVQVRVAR